MFKGSPAVVVSEANLLALIPANTPLYVAGLRLRHHAHRAITQPSRAPHVAPQEPESHMGATYRLSSVVYRSRSAKALISPAVHLAPRSDVCLLLHPDPMRPLLAYPRNDDSHTGR